MANIYKGFSTVNKIRAPYTLTDAELVKTDLLNELNTRQGERVMRPKFGTRIFDLLMNPLDEYVVGEVEDDVIRIVNKDPRVELQTVKTDVLDHTIRCAVQLRILPRLGEDELYVEYARQDVEV